VPTAAQLRSAAAWIERHLPLAAATLHRRGLALRPELRAAGALDLAYHFERREVPASGPGFAAAIAEHASALASRRLRRDRPLWRVTLLDADDGRRSCAIVQIHHAVADGASFAGFFDALTRDGDEAAAANLSVTGQVLAEASPRSRPVWFNELLRWLRGPVDLIRAIAGSVRGGLARARRAASTRPFAGPATRFNGPVSARRIAVWAELSLTDVKRVKDHVGVSVNDVLLGIVAHAARRLDMTGERPLVAAMPIGKSDEDERGWGNHLSNGFVCLHDDVDDPLERLRCIHASTEAAKAVHRADAGAAVAHWAELLTPTFVRLYRSAIRSLGRGAPVNLIVSNVRGPSSQTRVGPFKITKLASFGPLVECVGLNVTMWSYGDALSLGLHADAEQLPEVEDMGLALRAALQTLVALVDGENETLPPGPAGTDGRSAA